MILPKLELQAILKGKEGAATVTSDPPAIGDVLWLRESRRSLPACRGRVVDVRWCNTGEYEVLLEKAPESFEAPPTPPKPPRSKLTLSRAQRAKLFAGESPDIGGEGRCPVAAGETIRLSSQVTLNVLRVDPQRRGRWKLHYELVDTRDPVRLLRRTPPTHAVGDEEATATAGALLEASEQSSYTSSPAAAVPDAGEAPSREWLEVRAKTQSEFDSQRRLAKHAEKMRDKSKLKTKRRKAA